MRIDPVVRHESICRIIDQSLAGAATPEQERMLHDHLPGCAACSEHLDTGRRAIAGLNGFSFKVDSALDHKVLAALALRAQQMQARRQVRRQSWWSCGIALLLTATGSFLAAQLGERATEAFHLASAQLELGITTFWIAPSLCVCLLFLLLTLSTDGLSDKKGLFQ